MKLCYKHFDHIFFAHEYKFFVTVLFVLFFSGSCFLDDEPSCEAVNSKDSKLNAKNHDGACLSSLSGDKVFEALRYIHIQLDDDSDGIIEMNEADEFLRNELSHTSSGLDMQSRLAGFRSTSNYFGADHAMSMRELWQDWGASSVRNWTAHQTADWMSHDVRLPQYSDVIIRNNLDGGSVPRMAANINHYLSTVLGVKDVRHKKKIMLKAMDVVLFGISSDSGNIVKDIVLITLLVVSLLACWIVYCQNVKFKRRMAQMSIEMEMLSSAEHSLFELQKAMECANKPRLCGESKEMEDQVMAVCGSETNSYASSHSDKITDTEEELERLRSEVHTLNAMLRSRETSYLDERRASFSWSLQHWLQLTYELELSAYNARKLAAEQQLADARAMCDKLRRRQNSLYGSLISAHGRSVSDVDACIVRARNSLLTVTQELQERRHRWAQIEAICAFSVVRNPGLPYLRTIARSIHRFNAREELLSDKLCSTDSPNNNHSSVSELVGRSALMFLSSGSGVLPAAAKEVPSMTKSTSQGFKPLSSNNSFPNFHTRKSFEFPLGNIQNNTDSSGTSSIVLCCSDDTSTIDCCTDEMTITQDTPAVCSTFPKIDSEAVSDTSQFFDSVAPTTSCSVDHCAASGTVGVSDQTTDTRLIAANQVTRLSLTRKSLTSKLMRVGSRLYTNRKNKLRRLAYSPSTNIIHSNHGV